MTSCCASNEKPNCPCQNPEAPHTQHDPSNVFPRSVNHYQVEHLGHHPTAAPRTANKAYPYISTCQKDLFSYLFKKRGLQTTSLCRCNEQLAGDSVILLIKNKANIMRAFCKYKYKISRMQISNIRLTSCDASTCCLMCFFWDCIFHASS